MCLLIHKPADAEMTEELIMDVYAKNNDGFGVMYIDEGKLKVVKTLAGPDEIIPLYYEHCYERECIIHFRMQTHGDIDLDNCHPYKVTDDIWLAHNGILACGNPYDVKKSDTWHFIDLVLKPHLETDPDKILDLRFQEFIGDLIGSSNKFGLMRSDGEVVIINREAGVDHMGMWLSNTYAWSPAKFGYYPKYNSFRSGGYSKTSVYDDYESSWLDRSYPAKSSWLDRPAPKVAGNTDTEESEPEVSPAGRKLRWGKVYKAAFNSWQRGESNLRDWVYAAPEKAVYFLQRTYQMDASELEEMVNSDPDEAAAWISDILYECDRYEVDADNVMSYYKESA